MAKLRFVADRGARLPLYYLWDDAISRFCAAEDFAFLADRFGYLNQFTRINAAAISEGKLPAFDSTIGFSTCMESRASAIYSKCARQGCRCYVLWSGGCDSTGVVSALIDVGFPLDKLTVIYTRSSLEEYLEFFQYLVALGVGTHLVNALDIFPTALSLAKQGDIVLNGFPADQLFGSIIGQNVPYDTTKTHWTEYLKADKANQQYEAAFQYYGFPIKTVAEFLWFNNFALKWDYTCYSGLMMVNETHENIIPFYDTQEFQDWSASNFDILHTYDQKDVSKYKIQMKDYIHKVTRLDSVYGLAKVPSLAKAYYIEAVVTPRDHVTVSALDDAGIVTTMTVSGGPYGADMATAGKCCASIMRRYLKK